MKHHRLDDMIKGWFVGDFSPAAFGSREVEVALKTYAAGDREGAHHHRIATELTLIVSGEARMLGRTWVAGDIVTIEPGEVTAFEAVTAVTTVVVKVPSAANDKFLDNSRQAN